MFSFFRRKEKHTIMQRDDNPATHAKDPFDDPSEIFALFTRITGMHFDKKEQITAEKIRNFCLRREIGGFAELHEQVRRDESLMQELIDYLTVNETFFFRETEQIDILVRETGRTKRPMRILCAPCASGEEVYSIIIRLLEAGIPSTRFHITGIDINASAIENSREGLYSERSVNRIGPGLRSKYFTKEGGKYRIIPPLRTLPEFRKANIFDDTFSSLGSFDMIFSRNLFIYFDERGKRRAVEIFCSLLKPGGRIFFGHADNFADPLCLKQSFLDRTRVYIKV